MNIKFRLTVLNFLQFFIWGSWLITIGAFWFQNKHWAGDKFGIIFSTMGIASIFMPSITGIIADKLINAEKLLGICHICGAVVLCMLPNVGDPTTFFWVMLLNMMFYMPTISLSIAVGYSALKKEGLDVVKDYPPIRVWGTVGFIAALWTVSLLGFETSSNQFFRLFPIFKLNTTFIRYPCPTNISPNICDDLTRNHFPIYFIKSIFIK